MTRWIPAAIIAIAIAGCSPATNNKPLQRLYPGTVASVSGDEYSGWLADQGIENINLTVNDRITDAHDEAQYGFEKWVVWPESGAGDCDDYVVTKLQELFKAGYDRKNFRMASAHTEFGEFHIVILVNLDGRIGVLDNRRDFIVPAEILPYRWQAVEDPETGYWYSVPAQGGITRVWRQTPKGRTVLPPYGYLAYCSEADWDSACSSRREYETSSVTNEGDTLWK